MKGGVSWQVIKPASQTTTPGVSVAQVALRYTVNANLIFKWLRDPKYRPAPGVASEDVGLRFLPVEIVKDAPTDACCSDHATVHS